MTYQITIKFYEKLKFEIFFLKKLFLGQKSSKSFRNFEKLFFEHCHCVTYQITIKFHEKLKFEKKISKINFGSKKLQIYS